MTELIRSNYNSGYNFEIVLRTCVTQAKFTLEQRHRNRDESSDFWHWVRFHVYRKRDKSGANNHQIHHESECFEYDGIFCCVNGFFSESEDFLRLLRSSRLDIVHFISTFFPIFNNYPAKSRGISPDT